MLLNSYKITRVLPCLADPEKIRVIAEISDEIHEVFPFLNAVLKGCIYNHPALTLTIKKDGKLFTLHAHHITLAKIEDEKEAEEILKWLKDLINETYKSRSQIEPNYSMSAELKALDIFKLLPGTSCKKCGEMTCLAFAVKLVGRDIEITNCDPLFSEKYQEKCKVLLELLQAAGYEVPRQPIWRIDPDSYEYLMKNTYETMILQEYSLKMVLSDCNPSSQKVNAIAEFSEDIGEVLPYLNTVLRGIQYNETEKVLVVKKEGRLITFRPRQIALTKLEDENEARTVMEGLKQILNETYANKDHIKPTYISRPIPRPLDIFKLLPGKNCKECGQPTCMAFALKLVNDEVEWKQCPLILTKELERNRLKLMGILSDSEE